MSFRAPCQLATMKLAFGIVILSFSFKIACAKEALSMHNRTVMTTNMETDEAHLATLLKLLRQKTKEDLLEKPTVAPKTV